MSFSEVQKLNINAALLDKLKLNRKSIHYNDALELARLIILNYSPDIKGGKEKMLSLMFDMNVLWEEYVLVKLRQVNKTNKGGFKEYQVYYKDSKTFIGSNTLRPDDIVLVKDGKTYVIDTKWKRTNGSASVQDLRQMYTYCRFWNAEKAMLLCPGDVGLSTAFRSFYTDDYKNVDDAKVDSIRINHQCRLGFVSVLGDDDSLSDEIGEPVFGVIEE